MMRIFRVPRVDNRGVLNGIFWMLRSAAPRHDQPEGAARVSHSTTFSCYGENGRWAEAARQLSNGILRLGLLYVEAEEIENTEFAIRPFRSPPERLIGMVWRLGGAHAGEFLHLAQLVRANVPGVVKAASGEGAAALPFPSAPSVARNKHRSRPHLTS